METASLLLLGLCTFSILLRHLTKGGGNRIEKERKKERKKYTASVVVYTHTFLSSFLSFSPFHSHRSRGSASSSSPPPPPSLLIYGRTDSTENCCTIVSSRPRIIPCNLLAALRVPFLLCLCCVSVSNREIESKKKNKKNQKGRFYSIAFLLLLLFFVLWNIKETIFKGDTNGHVHERLYGCVRSFIRR